MPRSTIGLIGQGCYRIDGGDASAPRGRRASMPTCVTRAGPCLRVATFSSDAVDVRFVIVRGRFLTTLLSMRRAVWRSYVAQNMDLLTDRFRFWEDIPPRSMCVSTRVRFRKGKLPLLYMPDTGNETLQIRHYHLLRRGCIPSQKRNLSVRSGIECQGANCGTHYPLSGCARPRGGLPLEPPLRTAATTGRPMRRAIRPHVACP